MNWEKTVFLAHAKEDKQIVRHLYKIMKERGLNPWLDEESLLPGVNWNIEIQKAIRNTKVFLAIISSNSVSKTGYIQKELRLALSTLEHKPSDIVYFIPALIEDVELPELRVGTINLQDYQAVAINNDEKINSLIDYLTDLLKIDQGKETHNTQIARLIKAHVMNAAHKDALNILLSHSNHRNSAIHNAAILLLARFNRLEEQNLIGVISTADYKIDSDKILNSILSLSYRIIN